jgi:hypothetical protein
VFYSALWTICDPNEWMGRDSHHLRWNQDASKYSRIFTALNDQWWNFCLYARWYIAWKKCNESAANMKWLIRSEDLMRLCLRSEFHVFWTHLCYWYSG